MPLSMYRRMNQSDEDAARREVSQLVLKGLISVEGSRRGTVCRLAQSSSPRSENSEGNRSVLSDLERALLDALTLAGTPWSALVLAESTGRSRQVVLRAMRRLMSFGLVGATTTSKTSIRRRYKAVHPR